MNKLTAFLLCAVLCISITACATGTHEDVIDDEPVTEQDTGDISESEETGETDGNGETDWVITKDDIEIKEELQSDEDGEHVITADGETLSYSNVSVDKTGDSSGDEADFYGENAAVFATNGACLELSDMVIATDGTHANAVFSYGEGTTVTIKDSVIETSGNCSGGLMTTGGGTMIADDLNIHTTGNSSAAIRSDRGGGTVTVTGGSYVTEGTGSPAIYSTAEITVSNAYLESKASQGVVVEGKNSVTLNDVELVADNNKKNSDKSSFYQAVMIYQSMSGDAAEGLSSFTMNGGKLINKNGDIFFVNNTATEIELSAATIVNEDADGVFLRAAAAGWGKDGSNGGKVTLTAYEQEINGDILVDDISSLNLYLQNGSVFCGSVNPDGEEGEVYIEIDSSSEWILTSDAYITALTCEEGSVDLNGFTLYINGVAYDGGDSEGDAIDMTVSSGSTHGSSSHSSGHGGSKGS